MKTIFKVEHLNKVYRLGSFPRAITIRALHEVSVTVESDEPVIISIVGESGSGKTTLARVVLQLERPTSGNVIIHDTAVAGRRAMARGTEFLRMVQPIFQNSFEAFSRYRTIDSYLYETATRVNKLNRAGAISAVEDALSAVGLTYRDVRGKYSNQFSGGELQRVSIARALIPHPRLIVADEPVSMIDASRRMIIINLFLALKEEARRS